MTAAIDARTVMEKVLGNSVDDAQFQLIAGAFAGYRGSNFQPTDPESPTDEELAQAVLDAIFEFGTGVIGSQINAAAAAQATVAAAAQTAAVSSQFGIAQPE